MTTNDTIPVWRRTLSDITARALRSCLSSYDRDFCAMLHDAVLRRSGADIDEYRQLQAMARRTNDTSEARNRSAVEAEARRYGYDVAWRGKELTITRPKDGHSGTIIVGSARALVGSLFRDDRQLRLDAERIASMAQDGAS